MTRSSTFLYAHGPEALGEARFFGPPAAAGGPPRAVGPREFFAPGGGAVRLGVRESVAAGGEGRKSLTTLIRVSDSPVLLVGPSGSGKTAAAAHAFWELVHDWDDNPNGYGPRPVWLPPSPLRDFFQWVAAAVGSDAGRVADDIDYFPGRLVFFADSPDPAADKVLRQAAARLERRVDGMEGRGNHTLVVACQPERAEELARSAGAGFRRVEVCRPTDCDFAITDGRMNGLRGHLAGQGADELLTPLVYRFAAAVPPAVAADWQTPADVVGAVVRMQLEADLREPERMSLCERLERLRPDPGGCLQRTLLRLLAVVAFRQAAADPPADGPVPDPFRNPDEGRRLAVALGFTPDLAERPAGQRMFAPTADGYFEDTVLATFGRCRLFPEAVAGRRFVHDVLRHYLAGAVGLRELIDLGGHDAVGRVARAVLARPSAWVPGLLYLAGELSERRLRDLLAAVLLGTPDRDPAAAVGLARWRAARQLLLGRRPDDSLAATSDLLVRHAFAVQRWPELLPSLLPDLNPPAGESVRRLRPTSAAPAADPGRPPEARLHAAAVARVRVGGDAVYALAADGGLARWCPDDGAGGRWPGGEVAGFATAVDARPRAAVFGDRDGRVWLWGAGDRVDPARLYTHPSPVTAVEFVGAAGRVVVGHADGLVFHLDVNEMSPVRGSSAVRGWSAERSGVVRLAAVPGAGDRFVVHTRAGLLGLRRWGPAADPADPSDLGLPADGVTVLLPLDDGRLLVGRRDGRVGERRGGRRVADRRGPVVRGPVAGLAVGGGKVWASDHAGRVEPVALDVGPPDVRTAAGRLAWRSVPARARERGEQFQLVVGDRTGRVRLLDVPRLDELAREVSTADAEVLAFADAELKVVAVGRDGRVRWFDTASEAADRGGSFVFPDRVRDVRRPEAADRGGSFVFPDRVRDVRRPEAADGGLLVRTAGGEWFQCRPDGSVASAASRGGAAAVASRVPRVGRHIGPARVCDRQQSDSTEWASGGLGGVVAVWPLSCSAPDLTTTAAAAYLAPAGVSALRWAAADPRLLAVGLTDGGVLFLRLDEPPGGIPS